jgi:hypothetical protein
MPQTVLNRADMEWLAARMPARLLSARYRAIALSSFKHFSRYLLHVKRNVKGPIKETVARNFRPTLFHQSNHFAYGLVFAEIFASKVGKICLRGVNYTAAIENWAKISEPPNFF